jgi:hypothetical protein
MTMAAAMVDKHGMVTVELLASWLHLVFGHGGSFISLLNIAFDLHLIPFSRSQLIPPLIDLCS